MSYKQVSPLAVANGGTGAVTLTSGEALLGNGTSAFSSISFVGPTALTPQLQFGGASVGMTYTTQLANYWRIGSLVFVEINIVLSAKGSSTGNATVLVTGLPSAPAVQTSQNFMVANVAFTGVPTIRRQTGTDAFLLQESVTTGAQANLTEAAFVDTSVIRISGCYITTA